MAEWDKERAAGHAPMQYKRAVIALRGLAEELLKQIRDEAQMIALLSVLDAFEVTE